MKLAFLVLCFGILVGPPVVAGEDAVPPRTHQGWGWLVEKLVADGLDRERVTRVFDDPRLGPFTGLEFSLAPREPHSLYRRFLQPVSVAAARRCRATHASVLDAAERASGVPANVVAAILHVETGCGRNTGSSLVLRGLARLAMANEPATVGENVARIAGACSSDAGVVAAVRARAKYLEDTFYPEVRAAFALAGQLGVDPLDLRGSASGAIGCPQFLPSSYLRYGIDGGGDGRIDPYDVADAAASCANFLAAHGWQGNLSERARRTVLWQYNRSDAYVDTVLRLARAMDGGGSGKPAAVCAPVANRRTGARVARQTAGVPERRPR